MRRSPIVRAALLLGFVVAAAPAACTRSMQRGDAPDRSGVTSDDGQMAHRPLAEAPTSRPIERSEIERLLSMMDAGLTQCAMIRARHATYEQSVGPWHAEALAKLDHLQTSAPFALADPGSLEAAERRSAFLAEARRVSDELRRRDEQFIASIREEVEPAQERAMRAWERSRRRAYGYMEFSRTPLGGSFDVRQELSEIRRSEGWDDPWCLEGELGEVLDQHEENWTKSEEGRREVLWARAIEQECRLLRLQQEEAEAVTAGDAARAESVLAEAVNVRTSYCFELLKYEQMSRAKVEALLNVNHDLNSHGHAGAMSRRFDRAAYPDIARMNLIDAQVERVRSRLRFRAIAKHADGDDSGLALTSSFDEMLRRAAEAGERARGLRRYWYDTQLMRGGYRASEFDRYHAEMREEVFIAIEVALELIEVVMANDAATRIAGMLPDEDESLKRWRVSRERLRAELNEPPGDLWPQPYDGWQ